MAFPRDKTFSEEDVVLANRRFYDAIAPYYDQIDARRGGKIDHEWLDAMLHGLARKVTEANGKPATETRFLDAGAGCGFLARRAAVFFGNVTVVDISKKMLERIDLPADKIRADCTRIPVDPESFDVVGAFATLHHLHDPVVFFREAYRVLKPGGYLYCDHDIEELFVRRFRLPLCAYRYFFDHGHGYLKLCKNATASDYHLSEYHGDRGLSGDHLASALRRIGFEDVESCYHWEGMGFCSAIVHALGLRGVLGKRGRAPIFRAVARKKP